MHSVCVCVRACCSRAVVLGQQRYATEMCWVGVTWKLQLLSRAGSAMTVIVICLCWSLFLPGHSCSVRHWWAELECWAFTGASIIVACQWFNGSYPGEYDGNVLSASLHLTSAQTNNLTFVQLFLRDALALPYTITTKSFIPDNKMY